MKQVIAIETQQKREALEAKVSALVARMSAQRNKSIVAMYRFYLKWFKSFGIASKDPEFNKEVGGVSVVDIEKIESNSTDAFVIIQEIQEQNQSVMEPFQVLYQFKNNDKPDLDLAIQGLFAPAVELHPQTVFDYFEAVLEGKKPEFQFLTKAEHAVVAAVTDDNKYAQSKDIKTFIKLWKEAKINPALLRSMTQENLNKSLQKERRKLYTLIDLELTTSLVYAGADFTGITVNSESLLIWATRYGHTEVVKAILTSDKCTEALLSEKNNSGYTPLHLAAILGHTKVVNAILASDKCTEATLNEKDNNFFVYTALYLSAIQGHTKVVKAILASDKCTAAVLNEKNAFGNTTMHFAVRYGRTDVVKALLAKGADVLLGDVFENRSLFTTLLPAYIKQHTMTAITSTYVAGTAISILTGTHVPVTSNLNAIAASACSKVIESIEKTLGL